MRLLTFSGDFEITSELVAAFQSKYRAIDVVSECHRICLWSQKNSARRWKRPLVGLDAALKRANQRALTATGNMKLKGYATWRNDDALALKKAADLKISIPPGWSFADVRQKIKDVLESQHGR